MVRAILLAAVLGLSIPVFAAPELIERRFTPSEELLSNPGQGWMKFGSIRQKTDYPAGAIYHRLEWLPLEPEPGKYRWEIIDRLLAEGEQQRLPVLLRIMTASSHSGQETSTPRWVFERGARYTSYEVTSANPSSGRPGIVRRAPDFSDPIFLDAHERFIAALARRYDGDPRLLAIDIGSYGNWGEWHVYGLGKDAQKAAPEIRRRYADMYLKNFTRTRLVFMTDDAETLAYALTRRKPFATGLRRDGVGSPNHAKRWAGTPAYAHIPDMGEVWKHQPIVFEWYCNLSELHRQNWSMPDAVDWMLRNHVNLILENLHAGTHATPEERAKLDELTRRAGARLVPLAVRHPRQIDSSGQLTIQSDWENRGVARVLLPYRLEWSLTDATGAIVWRGRSDADVNAWLPGKFTVSDRFTLPAALKPGRYQLALALVDPQGNYDNFRLAVTPQPEKPLYPVGFLMIK